MTGTIRSPLSASLMSRQSQLGSSAQAAEQPSPEIELPSSHASLGSLRPSPHGEVQPFVPTHTGSARQSAPQPSPPYVLPSSHASPPSFLPSPHVVRWHAWPAGHAKPGSIRQVSLQPSPAAALPSSHCSPPIFCPSPQRGTQCAPA